MKIHEFWIPQLQQEVAITEKFLKRIPEDNLGWKPHEKSMTIKVLSNHIAEIPTWITSTMNQGSMDLGGYKAPDRSNPQEILNFFKAEAAKAEKALNKPDEEYQENWKLVSNGETMMEMSKYNVLQKILMGQFAHHRAQLGVYFRLLDIPVPSSYGPSADERQ